MLVSNSVGVPAGLPTDPAVNAGSLVNLLSATGRSQQGTAQALQGAANTTAALPASPDSSNTFAALLDGQEPFAPLFNSRTPRKDQQKVDPAADAGGNTGPVTGQNIVPQQFLEVFGDALPKNGASQEQVNDPVTGQPVPPFAPAYAAVVNPPMIRTGQIATEPEMTTPAPAAVDAPPANLADASLVQNAGRKAFPAEVAEKGASPQNQDLSQSNDQEKGRPFSSALFTVVYPAAAANVSNTTGGKIPSPGTVNEQGRGSQGQSRNAATNATPSGQPYSDLQAGLTEIGIPVTGQNRAELQRNQAEPGEIAFAARIAPSRPNTRVIVPNDGQAAIAASRFEGMAAKGDAGPTANGSAVETNPAQATTLDAQAVIDSQSADSQVPFTAPALHPVGPQGSPAAPVQTSQTADSHAVEPPSVRAVIAASPMQALAVNMDRTHGEREPMSQRPAAPAARAIEAPADEQTVAATSGSGGLGADANSPEGNAGRNPSAAGNSEQGKITGAGQDRAAAQTWAEASPAPAQAGQDMRSAAVATAANQAAGSSRVPSTPVLTTGASSTASRPSVTGREGTNLASVDQNAFSGTAVAAPVNASPAAMRGSLNLKPAGERAPQLPEAEMEAVERTAQTVRDISLNLSSKDQSVQVRLSERAGELHVSVRTPDAGLSHGLREGLSDLMGRLERGGYKAEAWQPAGNGNGNRDDSPSRRGSSQQQSKGNEAGRSSKNSEPDDQSPQWLGELESSFQRSNT